MGTVVTLLIVIPLLCYAGAFWGRLLRAGTVRLAKLAAGHQAERASGPDRPWEFKRPGEP